VFARHLTYDRWVGNRDRGTTVEHPSWAAIEERIVRLDAREFTMVTLAGEREAHMAIGGGAGRYVVYATRDNMSFDNLVDPARGEVMETVAAGGQKGEYPERQVVSLEKALEAAREYAETGTLSDRLQWEEG
jgi:hypothetical protein